MKILILTPTLDRTGSETVIYNLLNKCLSDNTEFTIAVTKKEGVLFSKIPENIQKISYLEYYTNQANSIEKQKQLIESIKKRYGYRLLRKLKKIINPSITFPEDKEVKFVDFYTYLNDNFKFDYWYINTLQFDLLDFVINNNIKTILHVHESEQILNYYKGTDLQELFTHPQLVIAVSNKVKEMVEICGRKGNTVVCYPCIDLSTIPTDFKSNLRKKLGINDKTFVWTMSGTLDYNKNPLIFVEIANRLIQLGHNVHFIWIGGGGESGYSYFAYKKAEYYNIENKITWTGKLTDDYYDHLNVTDGFILTSTKDSFPLVMIESAYLGKPIVGFNSGGIAEFINADEIGKISQSNDLNVIISIMEEYMRKEINYDKIKNNSQQYSIDTQFKTWIKELLKLKP